MEALPHFLSTSVSIHASSSATCTPLSAHMTGSKGFFRDERAHHMEGEWVTKSWIEGESHSWDGAVIKKWKCAGLSHWDARVCFCSFGFIIKRTDVNSAYHILCFSIPHPVSTSNKFCGLMALSFRFWSKNLVIRTDCWKGSIYETNWKCSGKLFQGFWGGHYAPPVI